MGYSKLSTGSKFKGKSDPKNPRLKNKKVDNGNISLECVVLWVILKRKQIFKKRNGGQTFARGERISPEAMD